MKYKIYLDFLSLVPNNGFNKLYTEISLEFEIIENWTKPYDEHYSILISEEELFYFKLKYNNLITSIGTIE